MTSIIEPAHTCCDHGYPRPPRGNRVHNFDGLETRLFLFVFAKEKTEIYNSNIPKKISEEPGILVQQMPVFWRPKQTKLAVF